MRDVFDFVRLLFRPDGPYLFVRLILAGYAISAIGRLIPVRRKQVAGYRQRTARVVALSAAGVAGAVGLIACTYVVGVPHARPPNSRSAIAANQPAHFASMPYLGVFEPDEGISYRQVTDFGHVVGRQPDVVLFYAGWNQPFPLYFAQTLLDHGAVALIQLEPTNASMADIAAGRYDSYLRSYADGVRKFGHQVILSFAPEANGSWYTWGWTHTPPRTWIAAWRHVVTVMRQQGARNVTWLWTLNVKFKGSGPVKDYWPGASYVDWVGIDGYFERAHATFTTVFNGTLHDVREVTSKPVLLSETAVGQISGQARSIPKLFAGVERHKLLGFVWFDMRQNHGVHHQDWRIEGNPAAIAAFRKALAEIDSSAQPVPDATNSAGRVSTGT